MRIMTSHIYPNEPCHGLYEGYKLAPVPGELNGAQDWRWIQQVWVIRDDAIACYETDFGSASDYELITPIFLPNEGTDSVAVLQAYAEKNRQDTYWQTRAREMLAESTLISDLIDQEAKIHEIIHNRTSIGPAVTVQRNGYAREVNQRNFKEKRQARTGKVKFLT